MIPIPATCSWPAEEAGTTEGVAEVEDLTEADEAAWNEEAEESALDLLDMDEDAIEEAALDIADDEAEDWAATEDEAPDIDIPLDIAAEEGPAGLVPANAPVPHAIDWPSGWVCSVGWVVSPEEEAIAKRVVHVGLIPLLVNCKK